MEYEKGIWLGEVILQFNLVRCRETQHNSSISLTMIPQRQFHLVWYTPPPPLLKTHTESILFSGQNKVVLKDLVTKVDDKN